MFIDRDITKYDAPFGGAECSGLVPVYLSSAPPNGAKRWWTQSYKHLTLNGGEDQDDTSSNSINISETQEFFTS
jgi:hypothetical protein